MTPTLWLLGILFLYIVAGAFVVLAVLAVRLQGWAAALLMAMGLVAGVAAPRHLALSAALRLWSGCGVAAAVLVAAYALLLRPRLTWRERKAGRETSRQTVLHLLLLSGSAIFLVPFAWLVVTSLKEDEDMS